MKDKPRRTGIEILGEVPWGSHVCMFYPILADSLAILASYFKAGLEDNEFCFWVVPSSDDVPLCEQTLRSVFSEFDECKRRGQIEIVGPKEWYLKSGKFDAKTVIDGWVLKYNRAIKMGFEGMRIAGDTSWMDKKDWAAFIDYETRVGDLFDKTDAMAICCYKLDCCDASGVIDVVSNHQHTLIKQGREWKLIENAERRKALEALQEAEERYIHTVENIPVAIYSALPDEHSTTMMVTEKVEDLLGYSAKELMERPELFGQAIHPDDREMVWKAIQEHRAKKSPLKLEYRVLGKDKKLRWVKDEALPVLDDKGELVRIDGFMEDITDLREIEDALRDSEERYKLAQRGAKIGSWDWDITSDELLWSEEIEPMFGFRKGGFAGTYAAFLLSVHPDDRKYLEDSVAACVEKGDRYDIEHRIVWPDGTVHWMSEAGDVIRNEAGKAVRMLGVVWDVTSKKADEERIRQLNKDLESRTAELGASNKELEAFCYSVSHDLRAPLRRIDGFSQLLLDDASDRLDEKSRSHLDRIRASTKHMDRLIEDLLRLSRITTAEISKEKVELTKVAQAIADRLSKSDPSRKVHFSIKQTPPAHGDKQLLEIAVGNLMENAWKFTGKRQRGEIEFGVKVDNGQSIYYVKDNGVGFDMDYSSKLFEPFQRLRSGEGFPGTGIGLAIVQRVISRHQGKVWAEGRPDKGATFYFTLRNGSGSEPEIN